MDKNLPKTEKLKSSKTIEKLFLEGKTFVKFPLKVFFIPSEEIENTQAAFAVPKRNFKKAVARNRIKRQLREAYRTNKQLVLNNNGKKFVLLFLYLGKELPTFEDLQKSTIHLLKTVAHETS